MAALGILNHMPEQQPTTDPYLRQTRHLALALPGASERLSHGAPAFFTTKMFASFGCHIKGGGQLPRSVIVKPTAAEREALLADARFIVPAYWGPYGWVALRLDHDGIDAADVDWVEVAELLEESFRLTAPKKLVAQLTD